METDSPVVYHGTTESRFPAAEIQKKQLQLTPDEMRILQECNRESFYYRCLPFALTGMTATFFAVKKGFLNPHPRWGAALKMSGAAFIGWILGKFSYRTICEDKFLHLKNSHIASTIRKKRGYASETFESESTNTTSLDDDLPLKDDRFIYSSGQDYHSSSGSLNLDTDKNIQYSGLDDRERPSTDREFYNEPEDDRQKDQSITYDELRQRNRDEYARQFKKSPSDPPLTGPQRPWTGVDPPKRFGIDSYKEPSKNIYGDSWDNPKFT